MFCSWNKESFCVFKWPHFFPWKISHSFNMLYFKKNRFSDLGLPDPHSASMSLSFYVLDWKLYFEKQTFFFYKMTIWFHGKKLVEKLFNFVELISAQRIFAFTELLECIADRGKNSLSYYVIDICCCTWHCKYSMLCEYNYCC